MILPLLETPVVEWLSVPLPHFFGCLQYPEVFIPLRQTSFLETTGSCSEPNQENRVMFHFNNLFLCQKLTAWQRVPCEVWSIVIVENPIVGPKFR
jgi:hypothetical protein